MSVHRKLSSTTIIRTGICRPYERVPDGRRDLLVCLNDEDCPTILRPRELKTQEAAPRAVRDSCESVWFVYYSFELGSC